MAAFSIQGGSQALSNKFVLKNRGVDRRVFGKKVGLIEQLFGCWHEDMSRPFSHEKIAYRSCLKCGVRKQFDSETLETFGAFYLPPVVQAARYF